MHHSALLALVSCRFMCEVHLPPTTDNQNELVHRYQNCPQWRAGAFTSGGSAGLARGSSDRRRRGGEGGWLYSRVGEESKESFELRKLQRNLPIPWKYGLSPWTKLCISRFRFGSAQHVGGVLWLRSMTVEAVFVFLCCPLPFLVGIL